MAGKKIKITLIKSACGQKPNQKKTAHALGLRKINASVIQNASPQILGMVRTVAHLIEIEEIEK